MILVIDNYDSFTYNLAHLFGELGAEVEVVRNDAITAQDAERLRPTPQIVRRLAGQIPILGVCLGHQSLVQAFGGRIGHARTLVHGKAGTVVHDGRGIFTGLEPELTAGRYHSLAATRIPDCLEISARSADGEVMAVRHRELPVDGLQFHPESVLTPAGPEIARNFLETR